MRRPKQGEMYLMAGILFFVLLVIAGVFYRSMAHLATNGINAHAHSSLWGAMGWAFALTAYIIMMLAFATWGSYCCYEGIKKLRSQAPSQVGYFINGQGNRVMMGGVHTPIASRVVVTKTPTRGVHRL